MLENPSLFLGDRRLFSSSRSFKMPSLMLAKSHFYYVVCLAEMLTHWGHWTMYLIQTLLAIVEPKTDICKGIPHIKFVFTGDYYQ